MLRKKSTNKPNEMNIARNKANEIKKKCHCLTLSIFSHARIFLWFLAQTQTTIYAIKALYTAYLASSTFGYFSIFLVKDFHAVLKP